MNLFVRRGTRAVAKANEKKGGEAKMTVRKKELKACEKRADKFITCRTQTVIMPE